MILDLISDSIKYSFSNPKMFIKFAICEFFTIFVFPLFLISGYQNKIITQSMGSMIHDDSRLPEFGDLKDLFLGGLNVFYVKFIYLLIPNILIFLLIYGVIDGLFWKIIAGALFALLFGYCYIAIPNMIHHNSIKKAFSFGEINNIILTKITLKFFFGVWVCFAFIYYSLFALLYDIITWLGLFINVSVTIFASVTLYKLLVYIISRFTIEPFIDIFIARISGVIYIGD